MDFYFILGLDRGASPEEIRRAYRRLSRKYHPDINPGDPAAAAFFERVNEAYATLSDPARRRDYDSGSAPRGAGSEASLEFQGFDFTATVEGPSASTFGELFADVFQPTARRQSGPAEDGVDLQAAVTLSFEQAMRGGEYPLTVTRLDSCSRCAGRGVVRVAEGQCQACAGTGSIRWARGHMVFARGCPQCGGTGRRRHQACGSCRGEGVAARTETVTVRIPPGVADGATLRVTGLGHAGRRGGRPGDLCLATTVQPHPVFRREGDDLHLDLPLAIHEAALGAKIEIPTIEGAGRLRVPPGTQSGQRFRLRGRGAPTGRPGARGDLVVTVRLVLPELIDERSKDLLREFGRRNPESVRRAWALEAS